MCIFKNAYFELSSYEPIKFILLSEFIKIPKIAHNLNNKFFNKKKSALLDCQTICNYDYYFQACFEYEYLIRNYTSHIIINCKRYAKLN